MGVFSIDNYKAALEVLTGTYGIGQARKEALTKAGYNYESVQSIVNSIVKDGMTEQDARKKLKELEKTSVSSFLEVDLDLSKYSAIKINIIGSK